MSKKYHYVYKLTHIETGEFYYGSRSTKFHPSVDSYLGSMKTWNPDKTKLVKEIIKDDFENRTSANKFEADIIREHIEEDLNRNYHIPSEGYHTEGMVTVKDIDGNFSKVSVDDPRYVSGELKWMFSSMVGVKDIDGNFSKVSVDDPRYVSGELISQTTGTITVKDIDGNFSKVSVDDPRYLSGELVGATKGTLTVKDKDGNTFNVSVDDPRYLNGELIGIWKNKKHSEETKRKIGEANSKYQKGINNSQYGKCWITNEKESKKIYKGDTIPEGWRLGRIQKKKCRRV